MNLYCQKFKDNNSIKWYFKLHPSISLILIVLWVCFLPVEIAAYSYRHVSKGFFTSIHILTVDPNEHEIRPVKALKRETVKTLVKRSGAVAGVNGGFWRPNGNPAGILKINHHWYGTPVKPRGAIGWSDNGKHVVLDRVLTNYQFYQCPKDCEIMVIPASSPPQTDPNVWKNIEHIIGGAPLLVSKGKIIEDFSAEQTFKSFLLFNFSRTAVGLRKSGEWVFVAADSQFFGFLGGLKIKDLAKLMIELGCVEALNLDGGGSTTMVLNGKVINDPSGKMMEDGKWVEAVSDAILIYPANSQTCLD